MVPGLAHELLIRNKVLAAESCVDTQFVPRFKQEIIGSAVLIDFCPDHQGFCFVSTAREDQYDKEEQGDVL